VRLFMRIMLINSPNEVGDNHKNANYALFPHIGIVQLATRIKFEFSNKVHIKVLDGGISSSKIILDEIKLFRPDLVGISVLTPTYSEGLKIAKAAKSCGAKVVLGDDHAIFFPVDILKHRSYVDFIITNDVAEQPLVELVSALYYEKPLKNVCSLAYRKDGVVCINPRKKYFLSKENTIPDLSLIENTIDLYSKKYYEAHGHLYSDEIRTITMNNARGCENGNIRCSYCSIADLSVNTGLPERHWNIVRQYHERYKINLFFEVYDSFTASPKYINALLETMPNDLKIKIDNGDVEFMIYARTLGLLKKDNVNKVRKMGVRRVNIGLDAGSKEMLEAQRKNKTTDETNLLALKLLKQADMSVHGSFILGAPGETVEYVESTMQHIDECIANVKFSSVEVSKLFPLPNSPIWDMMINYKHPQFYRNKAEVIQALLKLDISISDNKWNELAEKYRGKDLFKSTELMPDWYKNFTHVEEDYISDKIIQLDKKILSHNIQVGNNVG